MKYNLSSSAEKQNAIEYFKKILDSGCRIELKKLHKKRSLPQNAYLHVIFQCWGLHFGYTLDESKMVVKAMLGYTYIKNNTVFYDKTSKMDSKELTIFIDKFRDESSKQGCYLPSPHEINDRLMNEIESNAIYL